MSKSSSCIIHGILDSGNLGLAALGRVGKFDDDVIEWKWMDSVLGTDTDVKMDSSGSTCRRPEQNSGHQHKTLVMDTTNCRVACLNYCDKSSHQHSPPCSSQMFVEEMGVKNLERLAIKR